MPQRNSASAERTFRELLEYYREVKGDRHPETLDCTQSLASSLAEQGKIDEAKALEIELLRVSRETDGSRHPNTLAKIANLANTLRDQGDLEGAEALFREALAGSRAVHGNQDNNTLDNIAVFGMLLKQMGKTAEALALLQEFSRAGRGSAKLQSIIRELETQLKEEQNDETRPSTNDTVGGWRLAACRLKLWPESSPPNVLPYHHGWVHNGNERMLRRLIAQHQPRVIVEVGCWLGLCTTLLLEASSEASVFAIDRWDAAYLLEKQPEQYERDAEAMDLLRREDTPLFETFLTNLWPHRTRLFPLRMDALEGMETVSALGAPVGLVYIDADHTYEAVLSDVDAAARCFPDAQLCGDDWQWPGVRRAVEEYAEATHGCRVHAHAAENWWWIEKQRADESPSDPTLAGAQHEQAVDEHHERASVDFVAAEQRDADDATGTGPC